MKKFELIEALAEANDGNPEIEILMQTKMVDTLMQEEFPVNICTKDILSVEDDGDTIIIRCHDK
jgi:hypothetical protein